jgi:ATP-dependent Clp protease adapter protein ClpS
MSRYRTDHPSGSPEFFRPRRRNEPERKPPIVRYQLVLQAGAVKDMMLVVRTVMELTHLGRAEANHKMWQAYHGGRSQLLVSSRERAELYVEQFAERGVTVAIEPV